MLNHSYSHPGSDPCLQPTAQFMATPGIGRVSLWTLVGFVSITQGELSNLISPSECAIHLYLPPQIKFGYAIVKPY